MDTITLQCRFDLEGEPLYTLKWYKGGKEFYRYIPKEMPNTQVFPLPGINVDRSKSNPYEVVLRNVQPEATGKYKCEVSSDAPNFYTVMESAYLFVVDVPVDDPVMTVDKEVADVGSTLTGNCSAPASYPAANVTWYLNGRKIPQSSQRLLSPSELQNAVSSASVPSVSSRRMPMVAFSQLELEIDEETFQNGKARLKCTGTIFHLYKREKEIVLEEERPRPKPSSVLGIRDAAGGKRIPNCICLHVKGFNSLT
ncbi:unnamed protein product [Callosobruchus maculatus]|uniref:Ig-like domain-containing protein n=1 Tax=Callosobruchus maculatus TaxID=64391 RepID=A0A653BTD5_CALMS|nr:unnamed protein product [Callosobruchus maculatus]